MIITFVGPIASGKSTQRLLLCNELRTRGERVLTLTYPPFSYSTNMIFVLYKHLRGLQFGSANRTNQSNAIGYLETRDTNIVTRIIGIAILVDTLQLLFAAVLLSAISRLKTMVLIEDYIPVVLGEHILYSKVYARKDFRRDRFLIMLYRLIQRIAQKDCDSSICIYLEAPTEERVSRSIARGYREVKAEILHDRFRSASLKPICLKVWKRVISIDTGTSSPAHTFIGISQLLAMHSPTRPVPQSR